jgi:hypothetical protein
VDGQLPAELLDKYAKAKRVFAADVTGWDRRMHNKLMHGFFSVYMPVVCPGADMELLRMIESTTVESVLVFQDGTRWKKFHGNPSGFPNTLRLNSVVLRVCDLYIACKLSGCEPAEVEAGRFGEYCGDDSRVWVEDERFLNTVGPAMVREWNNTWSWEVKDEGMLELDGGVAALERDALNIPLFISRGVAVRRCGHNAIFLTPLLKADRLFAKLRYDYEQETEHDRILGVAVSMGFLTYMHLEGKMFVPAVEAFVEQFGDEGYQALLIGESVHARSLFGKTVVVEGHHQGAFSHKHFNKKRSQKLRDGHGARSKQRHWQSDEDYRHFTELIMAGQYEDAYEFMYACWDEGRYETNIERRLADEYDREDEAEIEENIDDPDDPLGERNRQMLAHAELDRMVLEMKAYVGSLRGR